MSKTLASPWWPVTYNFPSGDVDLGGWFSQTVINYEGTPKIERDVTEEVASFGKQLGIITEAVLEIADGDAGAKVKRLRDISERIEAIKDRNKAAAARDAEEAIERLEKLDKAALRALLRRYKA